MAEIITGKSYDLIEDNIKKIKELFPEIVTDGKIDLTKLSNLLGDYVETDNEKYR
jgi:adenine-specific DNA-methyltransferase